MTESVTFITYTKEAIMFVTTPYYETQFLNWLNSVGSSVGYKREVCDKVGIKCSPLIVHSIDKKEAVILNLVRKEDIK